MVWFSGARKRRKTLVIFCTLSLFTVLMSLNLRDTLKQQLSDNVVTKWLSHMVEYSSGWQKNNAIYEPDLNVTLRKFVASENRTVFILGAVAKNSTPNTEWDRFAVYGSWYNYLSVDESKLRCCFKDGSGTIIETKVYDYKFKDYYKTDMMTAPLTVWHITCARQVYDPLLISVVRNSSCYDDDIGFVKPFYAMAKPKGYIVISTKMAYGDVSPEIISAYLETAIYTGVDKVVTYIYKNTSPMALRMLTYYALQGILDISMIELPEEDKLPRNVPPLTLQFTNDQWVVMREVLERNVGASYFGIFDMDEYFIPSKMRSVPELLATLRLRHPTAAKFYFRNIHFFTDKTINRCVNVSATSNVQPSCSLFRRHIMTSPSGFNSIHEKMFLIPSRVETKEIYSHNATSLKGFTHVTVPESEGYVRHYGSCKRKFKPMECAHSETWLKDKNMIEWAERTIHEKVQKALKLIDI